MAFVSVREAVDSGAIQLRPRSGPCSVCGDWCEGSGPVLRCRACLWAWRRVVGILPGSFAVSGAARGVRSLCIYAIGEPDGTGGRLRAGIVRDWFEVGERAAALWEVV